MVIGILFPHSAHAAPTISNIKVSSSAHNEKFDSAPVGKNWAANAYITWQTDEPSTSKVLYTKKVSDSPQLTSYEQKVLTTNHIVRIQWQLEENSSYTIQVSSKNAKGEETILTGPELITPTGNQSKWWEVGHSQWYKNRSFETGTKWMGAGSGGYKTYCQIVTLTFPIEGAWIQMGRHHQSGPGLQLYVNGTKVGSWPYGFSLQTFDIKSYLVPGANTILLYQDTQNYELITQGEIVEGSGKRVSLHSDPTNWKASSTKPTNFNNCGGTTPVNKYDPLLSPFGSNVVSALPGATTVNNRETMYTATMSRLNKLLESTLFEPQEDRSSLSLPDSTEIALSNAIAAALNKAYSSHTYLELARQSLLESQFEQFAAYISQAQNELTDAETKGEIAVLLYKGASEQIYLTKIAEIVSMDSSASLIQSLDLLNQTIVSIGQNNYPAAWGTLQNTQAILTNLRASAENNWGYKLPGLNDSLINPLGFLRLRKSELFGMSIRSQSNQTVLRMKNDTNFAVLPQSEEIRFKDAIGFLSPFAVITPEGETYNFGSSATHVAFELNGQVVVKPVSGSIYTKGPTSDMTANWLFTWNSANKASAYLTVFQKKPKSIGYLSNDIVITNADEAESIGKLVVMTPYSDGASFTSTTTDFTTSLGINVIADIQKLSRIMTKVPLTYSEAYKDDPSNNRGEVFIKYSYFDLQDEWGTPSITIAPLPTLLTFAKKNNYPGISISDPSTDSRLLISETLYNWGSYEFVEGKDTLHYYTPLLRDGSYIRGINSDGKEWDIQKAKDLGFNAIRLNVGDLVLDYASCGFPNCNAANTFKLKSGWQSALMNQVEAINNKGLKAILIVWNAVGQNNQSITLETNSANQTLFIDAWKQIATELKTKNVAYDLVNEPDFNSVAIYNTLMTQVAQKIRGEAGDTANPIMIEGYTNYAKSFQGMTHPGTAKTYFEHHPYPNGYYQTYSTLDQYYPGLTQDWWNNVYTDRDTYFEEFWKGNVRKIFQDKINFYNGEFGMQVAPPGSKSKMLYDIATLNYRYGIHQTYFKGTGWTMFDLFAGQGPETHSDTESINALLTKYTSSSPPPTNTPLLGDINSDGVVNILDYILLSNKFGLADSASDLNKDGIVNILDFIILSNNFGVS